MSLTCGPPSSRRWLFPPWHCRFPDVMCKAALLVCIKAAWIRCRRCGYSAGGVDTVQAAWVRCRRCGYGAGGVGSSEGRARCGTRHSLALTFRWPELSDIPRKLGRGFRPCAQVGADESLVHSSPSPPQGVSAFMSSSPFTLHDSLYLLQHALENYRP